MLPVRFLCLALLAVLAGALPAFAAPPSFGDDVLVMQPARRGGTGRVPFSADAIALQVARGELGIPRAGQDGWESVKRAEDGSFPVRGGSYAAFIVEAEQATTMLLKASGHGMVYVNGEPRAGDPYAYGFLQLPVQLKAGENLFLFQHGRGALRAELSKLPAEVFILEGDLTSPDFLLGRDETLPLGAMVVNATEEPVTATPWTSTGDEGEHARIEGAEMTVPAMSVRKVVFPVHYDGRAGEATKVTLGFGEHEAARREVDLAIKAPGQMYKRTFLSRIEGSVQYYAVQPRIPLSGGATGGLPASAPGTAEPGTGGQAASGTAREGEAVPVGRLALVLSLHGASVEATNQANAYAPKTWCDIVCPTNRRPFGFDWEEWGRIDAIEVLDDAMRHLNSDPSRVYLTGHSMGGHGTWSVAAHYPDRFAAIGPSAGWLSFATYGGAGHPQLFEHTEGVAGIFARAARASDTSLRLSNLKGKGIYILHGDADDNVPIREARQMAERLKELGIPFEYHEQPGAGHWWDGDRGGGADCVDWPEMFELFQSHQLSTDPAAAAAPEDRAGFKQAFDHGVVFVYGTKGTPEETAWARAKARYDAESFYYRGNGSIAVVADTAFDPQASADHSVILYGNADTHEDWAALLGDAPVELRRGRVKVGDVFAHDGEDRAIVFCFPRNGSERALVGVVGGTGLVGMRLTDRLPYFTSGVHYPDWTVFGPGVYEHGYEAADAAGYFDNAWKPDAANSAVRDPAAPLPTQPTSRPTTRGR